MVRLDATKAGTWTDSDGESGGQYAVFAIGDVLMVLGIAVFSDARQVVQALADENNSELAQDLTGWARFYRGPGRAFGHEPVARVYRHAVLVYQRTGLDI